MEPTSFGTLPFEQNIVSRLKSAANAFGVPFLSTWIFGLAAHLVLFVNKLPNQDELHYLFRKGETVTSGRWGLALLEHVIPNYSMPLYHGLLSLVFLSLAVCVLTKAINIRSRILQALFSGLITVFPAVTSAFSYMFTSSGYCLAFLLASLPCLLLSVRKKRPLMIAFSVLCVTLATGIYQAFLCAAAAFLLIFLLKLTLDGEIPIRSVIREALIVLGVLAAGFLLYGLIQSLAFRLTGVTLHPYIAGQMRASESVGFFTRILDVYRAFVDILFHERYAVVPLASSRAVSVALWILSGLLVLVRLIQMKKEPSLLLRFVMAGLFLTLLPFSMAAVTFISNEVHLLMLFGFTGAYLLFVFAAGLDSVKSSCRFIGIAVPVVKWGVTLGLAALLCTNIYVANERSLEAQISYERTYAFFMGLASDITCAPGFTESTEIALIGTPEALRSGTEEFRTAGNTVEGYSLASSTTAGFVGLNRYAPALFLSLYTGWNFPFVSEEQAAEIEKSTAVQAMPCYPYDESIAVVDGVLVVKLG